MPPLSFADARHGWRVDPTTESAAIERTVDGGWAWSPQFRVTSDGDSVAGVVAVDDRHAFALVASCCDGTRLRLFDTTDGVHWKPTLGFGLKSSIVFASFIDAEDGWAIVRSGDLVSTADGGDHWHSMSQPPDPTTYGGIESVCLGAPGAGWLATAMSVYRSSDDGASWQRQLTIPVTGSTPSLECRGSHVAYASFAVGAGQHLGAFMRSDDGGAHWRPLTEDTVAGRTAVTAPRFPDDQYRGDPVSMQPDGSLLFTTGSNDGDNWIVFASLADRFVVDRFDSTPSRQIVLVSAAAADNEHAFVETQTLTVDGTGPRPVSFYATDNAGNTWQLRWRSR